METPYMKTARNAKAAQDRASNCSKMRNENGSTQISSGTLAIEAVI